MNDASAEMPLFLVTVVGTLLFFDQKSRQVRHGKPDESPQNLAYVSTPQWRSLAVLREGKWEKLTAGSGSTFDLGRVESKGIVLLANKRVLYLESNGSISFDALPEGQNHASLYPLTQAEAAYLRHILINDWRSAAKGGIVRSASIQVKNNFMVSIGEIDVSLLILLSSRDAKTHYQKSLTLFYDGWKLEHLTLYRPLVYFTAFGRPDIFSCLDLALRSLAEIGHYDGKLLVLTEKTPEEFSSLVAFRSKNLSIAHHAASDRLGFSIARYAIADMAALDIFQPLLYLDSDVLCVAPIGPMLEAILRAHSLCATLEAHDLLDPQDWFGASLFGDDSSAIPRLTSGLNTGVLGAPSVAAVREPFVAIRDGTVAVARVKGNRDWSPCYDQAVANYVLHKGFAFDIDALSGMVGYSAGTFDQEVVLGQSLLIHFLGGFGHAAPKAIRMSALLDRLLPDGLNPTVRDVMG